MFGSEAAYYLTGLDVRLRRDRCRANPLDGVLAWELQAADTPGNRVRTSVAYGGRGGERRERGTGNALILCLYMQMEIGSEAEPRLRCRSNLNTF